MADGRTASGRILIRWIRRAGWKHGSWHDTGWMQLDLVTDPDATPTELR